MNSVLPPTGDVVETDAAVSNAVSDATPDLAHPAALLDLILRCDESRSPRDTVTWTNNEKMVERVIHVDQVSLPRPSVTDAAAERAIMISVRRAKLYRMTIQSL